MKKIFVLFVLLNTLIFSQIGFEKISRSDYQSLSKDLTYEDSNYMPLKIGNLYQFIESGYGGGVVWSYLRSGTVSRDTLINEQRYYLYTLHNTNHWFRYPVTEKKLYEWYNSEEMLYMDFNKAPGDTFIHLNHNLPATVSGGATNLFSQNFAYKGLNLPLINATSSELFAKGLGLYYSGSQSSIPNGFRKFTLIMAKLIDSLGNIIQYTDHYKPLITINPITLINTGNFNLGFRVVHQFDKPVPPGHTPMFFISSVKFDSYYSSQDSIIQMPIINATGIRDYDVNTILDTILMKNGFDFNYRIIAVDKGIIPETSYSPDSGYYKCVWDFSTDVDIDDELTINEFSLSQNYPNPFNPSTIISYQLPFSSWVTLKIFNALGCEVETLINEYQDAGNHSTLYIVNSTLPSGIYFYQLKAGESVQTKKMLLVK